MSKIAIKRLQTEVRQLDKKLGHGIVLKFGFLNPATRQGCILKRKLQPVEIHNQALMGKLMNKAFPE